MDNIFLRTKSLIGDEKFTKLQNSHIVLCGCGGVGSYALEAIVRSGVGKITVIDNDTVSETNINRQIVALQSTIGQAKVAVAKMRALDINPDIVFNDINAFLTADDPVGIIPVDSDYIIDAIDFVPAKVALAKYATQHNIPIICCLGTGNRLDATKFSIKDIYTTAGCPLARKMRTELKKAGISKLDVLFSDAEVITPQIQFSEGKRTVGSVSFVPSVAGLLCAQYVITNIMEKN